MANFRYGAAALTLTFVAAASAPSFAQDKDARPALSSEGVVTSETSCEYEGGFILPSDSGKICLIAVRGDANSLNTVTYDGQALGVIKCSGNGAYANELIQPSGNYCRVYLEQKKVAPSRAEIEAVTRAEIEEETSSADDDKG